MLCQTLTVSDIFNSIFQPVFPSLANFPKPSLTMAMTSPIPLNVSIKNPDDLSLNSSPRSPYLKEDDEFPRITLTDENGRPISLHAHNNRPKLVVFYRGAFCNYCEGKIPFSESQTAIPPEPHFLQNSIFLFLPNREPDGDQQPRGHVLRLGHRRGLRVCRQHRRVESTLRAASVALPHRLRPHRAADGEPGAVHPHQRPHHLAQVRVLHAPPEESGRFEHSLVAQAVLRAGSFLPKARQHREVFLPARRAVPPVRCGFYVETERLSRKDLFISKYGRGKGL